MKLRLGRIGGVDVIVSWSLAVVAVLLTASLSLAILPETADGYSTAAYVVAGMITATAFLASLLAHELSHSLVARSRGVEVESITLWLFGGVARLRGEVHSPGDLLRITLAGPAMSMALGVAGLLLATVLGGIGASQLAFSALMWFGATNLVLAAFNLLPAVPLDGGRVLTALLWHHRGDRLSAEESASRVGQFGGHLITLLGVALLFLGAGLSGLWLAVLGWFLTNSAQTEQRAAATRQLMTGWRLESVMTPSPVTMPAGLTVSQLVDRIMTGPRVSSFPLYEPDGRISGLLTLAMLRHVHRSDWDTTALRDIAVPISKVATAAPSDLIADVVGRLGPDGRILVFDEGALVGIISPTDLARLIDRFELVGENRR